MLQLLSQPKLIATALLVMLVIVLALAVADFSSDVPPVPEYDRRPGADAYLGPINTISDLFASNRYVPLLEITNQNPFFTTYFQPPPPPKPPSSKKIELTYQGFYQTADGQKFAFLKIGDSLSSHAVDSKVEGQLTLVDIRHLSVTLQDAAGKSHTVKFNEKAQIQVPR